MYFLSEWTCLTQNIHFVLSCFCLEEKYIWKEFLTVFWQQSSVCVCVFEVPPLFLPK